MVVPERVDRPKGAEAMTARVYPSAFSQLAAGTLDWTALDLRAVLLSEAFVYDETMQYFDEVNTSFIIAESELLTNATYEDEVFGGSPFEWLQLSDNRSPRHILIYEDSGDDAYSDLIAYYSAASVDGLPQDLNGQNYYLYPVFPPGGFFELGEYASLIGPINSYALAYALPLGESIGSVAYTIPTLVFGLDLAVRSKVCYLPDEVDSPYCGPPTIRSSLCD